MKEILSELFYTIQVIDLLMSDNNWVLVRESFIFPIDFIQ